MNVQTTHRLDGLEPDNLLAFLALLGLLRALGKTRPTWRPRASWAIDPPPTRPVLHLAEVADHETVASAVADGLNKLAFLHEFGGFKDLTLSPADAPQKLRDVALGDSGQYGADLWAALISDAAVSKDGKKTEPTPLCLMFGQGHQHFLERLSSVPQQMRPPTRGKGRKKTAISETDCLCEALFAPWKRPDNTPSFRWDPNEDVRYALRATDPTDQKTKERTQHGANRLAAIGISALTVVPQKRGGGETRLGILGGGRDPKGGFHFTWPIWCHPISLTAIRALLGHPGLDDPMTWTSFGVIERRRTRRISAGKFMNFTRAETLHFEEESRSNRSLLPKR